MKIEEVKPKKIVGQKFFFQLPDFASEVKLVKIDPSKIVKEKYEIRKATSDYRLLVRKRTDLNGNIIENGKTTYRYFVEENGQLKRYDGEVKDVLVIKGEKTEIKPLSKEKSFQFVKTAPLWTMLAFIEEAQYQVISENQSLLISLARKLNERKECIVGKLSMSGIVYWAFIYPVGDALLLKLARLKIEKHLPVLPKAEKEEKKEKLEMLEEL